MRTRTSKIVTGMAEATLSEPRDSEQVLRAATHLSMSLVLKPLAVPH